MRINNLHYVRGRFVRDPITSDAKDGSGRKFVFGRLAVDQSFTDQNGDAKTRTGFYDLKVFMDDGAKELIEGNARTGTLIEVKGSSWPEVSEYEKDGEKRQSFSVAMVVDNPEHHSVKIESHPRSGAAA